MKNHENILSTCPLFENIGADDLKKMLVCFGAKVGTYDKKYTIIAEGNPAKYIGIVLDGSVQMIRVDYYGNRSIIAEVGPGELFGEAFACAGVDAVPVTVVANEASEIMLIDSNHILHTCENNCGFHQQIIYNLMKTLAVKTLAYHRKLEITSKRTTRDKLMTYLMLCSEKERSASFEIPFDRQELSDYLEVERSGLSAEIGKLKKEGIIECEKNRFTLL